MAAAAQTLTASIGRTANLLEVNETLVIGVTSDPLTNLFTPSADYVNGNSATALAINQWFMPASSPITLASSASVTYTLTNLTDNLGRTCSFAGGVRAWGIYVTSRTAGDFLTVGNAASNPWTAFLGGTTPTFKVWDLFFVGVKSTDKYAVTAASNEQLKIVNSGSNNITFQLILAGCLT